VRLRADEAQCPGRRRAAGRTGAWRHLGGRVARSATRADRRGDSGPGSA